MMMLHVAKKMLAAGAIAVAATLEAGELPAVDSKTEFIGVYWATLTRTPEALVFTDNDKDMKTQLKLPPFLAAEEEGDRR